MSHVIADDVFARACCVTLVCGLDVDETFARLSADTSASMSVRFDELVRAAYDEHERGPGRQLAGATLLDGWTLVLEPNGYACSDSALLREMSAGTTSVTLYHSGIDEDEITVMIDGRRSQLLDLGGRGCHVDLEPLGHETSFWATSGPALVERFSGVRLDAELLGCLSYRLGLLPLW